MRLSQKAHLSFDKSFERLTILSKVKGLMALSRVDPLTSLRVDAEPYGLERTAERQCRSIEG